MADAPTLLPPVEIRTSTRRRKTAVAFLEGETVVVVLPSWMSGRARDEMVESLVQRVLTRNPYTHASDEALAARAAELADQYLFGRRPSSIRWVSNQMQRWGSCSIHSGEIRISDRLRPVPPWVLDAVLVHELAHLEEASHSPRFRQLTARFERTEDARAFLEGYGLGLAQPGRASPATLPSP